MSERKMIAVLKSLGFTLAKEPMSFSQTTVNSETGLENGKYLISPVTIFEAKVGVVNRRLRNSVKADKTLHLSDKSIFIFINSELALSERDRIIEKAKVTQKQIIEGAIKFVSNTAFSTGYDFGSWPIKKIYKAATKNLALTEDDVSGLISIDTLL